MVRFEKSSLKSLPPSKLMLKLYIDDREKALVGHLEKFKVQVEIKRITIGDLVLVRICQGAKSEISDANGEEVLAVFERKTLKDYAGSLQDGRHENRLKMIELREETNCRLYYVVEGPLNPADSTRYGRIPFDVIQRSMDNLSWQDNIHIMRTPNVAATAKRISDFCLNLGRLLETESYTGKPAPHGLAKRHIKTMDQIVLEMWRCIPGIGLVTARANLKTFSLAQILLSTEYNAVILIKILATVPLISRKTAETLLSQMPINKLLSLSAEDMAGLPLSAKRRLTMNKAMNILQYFNHRGEENQSMPVT